MTTILKDPLAPLQKAMYDALTSNAQLQALNLSVFDRVSDENFPYAVIGEDRASPDDNFCRSMTDVFSTVRVYTRGVGKVEAKQIAGIVRWVLDKDHGFSVPEFKLLSGYCSEIDIDQHSDGLTNQGILNFNYTLFPLEEGGNLSTIFADMAVSSVGALAINGDLNVTFDDMVNDTDASLPIDGDGVYFGDMAVAASGSLVISGTLSATFDDMSVTGDNSVITVGNLATTFDAMGVSANAVLTLNGDLNTTFDDMIVSGETETTTSAGLSTVFDDMTASGDASLIVSGDLATTFDDMSALANGEVDIQGDGSFTFDDMTVSGATLTQTVGNLATTFDAMALAATGSLAITGDLSATFGEMTTGGASELPIDGDGVYFGNMTLAAEAELLISATGSLSFDDMNVSSNAEVDIQGDGAFTFDAMTVSGAGELQAVASYETEAQAIFDQMSPTPNDTRKGHINDLVAGLKTDGIWSKLSWISIIGDNKTNSYVNWVDPTDSLTENGSPSIVADSHFDRDGTGNDALIAGPANAGSVALGNFAFGLYYKTLETSGSVRDGRTPDNTNWMRSDFSAPYGSINGGSNMNASVSRNVTARQLSVHVHDGTGANGRKNYNNGTVQGEVSGAGGSLSTSDFELFGFVNGTGNSEFFAGFYGEALTQTNCNNLKTRLDTYLTAIGAI